MKEKIYEMLYHKNPEDKVISNFSDRTEHNFRDPDILTDEEVQYLYKINRKKWNPGVEKRFMEVKKKRKYFDIL